jgi:hypothetical protein
MPRGRKKQKQRTRRSVAMEKNVDKMNEEGLQKSVDDSRKKLHHRYNRDCLCPECIDEETRDIPKSEVDEKEKWIEDFRPTYEKACLNLNKKNKLIIQKYIGAVYALAELTDRYERNKKIHDLISQMKF